MPRTARASLANDCYHVLNRGNARSQVFHKDADYASFVELIDEACRRQPMRVLAYCLMPNHFHLVLWPLGNGDLSTWMGWLINSHVRRYHRHYHSSGHIWQGRFKAFPIEEDEHLRVVLSYVERNPLRAGLVERAEDWVWSSLPAIARSGRPSWLDPGPSPRGRGWVKGVNGLEWSEAELGSLRRSVERGTPFGLDEWALRTAGTMGLESTIRARGRPRKVGGGVSWARATGDGNRDGDRKKGPGTRPVMDFARAMVWFRAGSQSLFFWTGLDLSIAAESVVRTRRIS